MLDNILCALELKQYNDMDDPFFKNMGIKIKFMNLTLDVFGFKSMTDFKTKSFFR